MFITILGWCGFAAMFLSAIYWQGRAKRSEINAAKWEITAMKWQAIAECRNTKCTT